MTDELLGTNSNIVDKLSHIIDDRLQPGSPLPVFDAYIFSKTEHYDTEVSPSHGGPLARLLTVCVFDLSGRGKGS